MRDMFMDDRGDGGCLECGALRFRASFLHGVCDLCVASSMGSDTGEVTSCQSLGWEDDDFGWEES